MFLSGLKRVNACICSIGVNPMLRKWPLLVSLLLPSFIRAKENTCNVLVWTWALQRDKMACFHFSKLVFFLECFMAFVPFFTLTCFTHTSSHNVTTLANITNTVLYTLLSFSILPSLVHSCQHIPTFNGIRCYALFIKFSPFVECIMLTLTLNKVQLVHHV